MNVQRCACARAHAHTHDAAPMTDCFLDSKSVLLYLILLLFYVVLVTYTTDPYSKFAKELVPPRRSCAAFAGQIKESFLCGLLRRVSPSMLSRPSGLAGHTNVTPQTGLGRSGVEMKMLPQPEMDVTIETLRLGSSFGLPPVAGPIASKTASGTTRAPLENGIRRCLC